MEPLSIVGFVGIMKWWILSYMDTVFPVLVLSILLFLENIECMNIKEPELEVTFIGFLQGKRFQSLPVASLEGHGVEAIGCLKLLAIIEYNSLRILFLERVLH